MAIAHHMETRNGREADNSRLRGHELYVLGVRAYVDAPTDSIT